MTISLNLEDVSWQKSSFSAVTECVELAALPSGGIAVRNSNAPEAGVITFTRREIDAFLLGAKAGEFDGFGTS